jgi:hypothetical protein
MSELRDRTKEIVRQLGKLSLKEKEELAKDLIRIADEVRNISPFPFADLVEQTGRAILLRRNDICLLALVGLEALEFDASYIRLRDAFACAMNYLENEEGELPSTIPEEIRVWLDDMSTFSTLKADAMSKKKSPTSFYSPDDNLFGG